MKKLTEGDLVIPVLAFLNANGGSATIAQITGYIRNTYPLSEADLRPLPTRPGEKMFEQQIRNLRSHHKLPKLGLAENIPGGFRLLPGISEMLEGGNAGWMFDMVASQPVKAVRKFVDGVDRRKKMISLDENASEGVAVTVRDAKRRSRSARLRQAAIERFTRGGVIACHCCGMTFEDVYGPAYGVSCIEIHHKKPIYTYDDSDIDKTVAEALKNVIPVCPNCHRIIHRNKLFSDAKIAALKASLSRKK